MEAIGGYFELELPIHKEYHANALALNSGRSCLEYVLRCRNYKMVYVPYYTCDTTLEPFIKLGVEYKFYHIDKSYQIVDDITLAKDEALLYTNYWGLQNLYCKELVLKYGKQLILDYTQSFFSMPIKGIDTFYSCRKFFGVPDGGYLYTDAIANFELEQDESYLRMDSLIKRVDISPEAGYEDFQKVSASFHNMSIRRMSKLTKRLMQSIDYTGIAQKRIDNYNSLRRYLDAKKLEHGEVPMIFPYISTNGQQLRKHLITNKVFVAKYWHNVDDWTEEYSVERWMANNVIPLPIDQRYEEEDMRRIISLINK